MAALRTGLDGPEAGRTAFLDLKGALGRALGTLAPVELAYERAEAAMFHPGRCATVLVCGQPAGQVGELHPTTARAFDLEGRAVAMELDLAPVLAIQAPRRVRPLPRF